MSLLSVSPVDLKKVYRSRESSTGSDDLQRRAERLLATEISFVHRPDHGRKSEPVITDLDAFLADTMTDSETNPSSSKERSLLPVPNHLLSRDQERALFLHMNYLKFRANALRSRIDPSHPSMRRIVEIESLLTDVKRIGDRLTECNLRLVLSIARKLSKSQGQFEELVSDGLPILMRCVELFDAARGYRFSTYVTHSVQRHLYRVMHRTQRRRHRFVATDAEILTNVAENPDERPDSMLDHAEIVAEVLRDANADLDARERLIIFRRFGLDGNGSRTLRQIAEDLGISKERVRQLQLRAMDKLHDAALSLNFDPDLLVTS